VAELLEGSALCDIDLSVTIMSSFSSKGLLGELEQLVLLAAIRLGDDAYAVSIRDEIETRAGVNLSRSSVYVTLDRLDRKGYVTSSFGDPTPERGGKAKRCFRVAAAGRRALDEVERTIARLRVRPLRTTR
jgi:PadR family transcriptional regulator PadR